PEPVRSGAGRVDQDEELQESPGAGRASPGVPGALAPLFFLFASTAWRLLLTVHGLVAGGLAGVVGGGISGGVGSAEGWSRRADGDRSRVGAGTYQLERRP